MLRFRYLTCFETIVPFKAKPDSSRPGRIPQSFWPRPVSLFLYFLFYIFFPAHQTLKGNCRVDVTGYLYHGTVNERSSKGTWERGTHSLDSRRSWYWLPVFSTFLSSSFIFFFALRLSGFPSTWQNEGKSTAGLKFLVLLSYANT